MQIVIALDTLKKQGYKVYPTNLVMDLIMTRYDSYGTRLEKKFSGYSLVITLSN